MKCPRCQSDLSEEEVHSLWGQLCRSKSSPLSKRKAKERAKKAAAARWAAGAGKKKPRAKKGKALNDPKLSDGGRTGVVSTQGPIPPFAAAHGYPSRITPARRSENGAGAVRSTVFFMRSVDTNQRLTKNRKKRCDFPCRHT